MERMARWKTLKLQFLPCQQDSIINQREYYIPGEIAEIIIKDLEGLGMVDPIIFPSSDIEYRQ